MKVYWLSKALQQRNILAFPCRTQILLRDAAFSSYTLRKRPEILHDWGKHDMLQIEKELGKVNLLTRQFHMRCLSYQKEKKPETLQELVESTERPQAALTVGQKVAQAGKDVSYFAIILAGFAVTGALLWYVFSELFLSSSPNKIYTDALKKIKLNEEVLDALGEPIKAYGEETSRGRRRHVSFQEYIVAGENYMRVKFYVAGTQRKGTVHVDVKQVSSRRYEYRFIFVELEGFPSRTIIIEDNRYETD